MKTWREQSPAARAERSERDAPGRSPAREHAARSARGASLDALGNRDRLSLLRSEPVQRKAQATSVEGSLHGGQGLDPNTRALMESRFLESFGDVRVHTGDRAAEMAAAEHSRAFTVRDHIVFGQGTFAPASTEGLHLLAHELAHVVQQRQQTGAVANEKDLERDADAAARELAAGGTPAVRARASAGTVQRAPLKDVPADYGNGAWGQGQSGVDWDIEADGRTVAKAYDVPQCGTAKPASLGGYRDKHSLRRSRSER